MSERDGNLELYQQQLSKERRNVGGEAAEGDLEASVQHRAAPKRLTYAVSMQVCLLCSGILLMDLGAAAKLSHCDNTVENSVPITAGLSWSMKKSLMDLHQSLHQNCKH